MAIRPAILWIGDDSIKGTRPVSELTAIDPSFADPQTGTSRIWNIQTQAWETTTPGANTDTIAPGSDRWGPEARIRAALTGKGFSGSIDQIKIAVPASVLSYADGRRNADGSAAAGPLLPSWFPNARDTTAYSKMVAQVKAAALANSGLGDTTRIDAVVVSIYQSELFLGIGTGSYGSRMADLVNNIYADLLINGVAMGSLRGPGLTPFVFIPPHAAWSSGLPATAKGNLLYARLQLEGIKSDAFRLAVADIAELTTSDGTAFDAQSLVTLSARVADSIYAPAAIDNTGLADAEMFCVFGDSIFDGTGNAPHPAYLTGAQTGVNIFSRDHAKFETAQLGVNTLISAEPSLALLDVGLPLGLMHRQQNGTEVYYVKATMIGSTASDARQRWVTPIGPLHDVYVRSWDPGVRNSMSDLALYWVTKAAAQLRKQGKRARVKKVYICLGTNDLVLQTDQVDPESHIEAVPAIKQFKRRLDKLFRDLQILPDEGVRYIFCLPTTKIAISAPWSAGNVDNVRAEFLAWAETEENVFTLDTDSFGRNDNLHLNTQGTLDCAAALFAAGNGGTQQLVQPLFAASRSDLRRALRLSQVPDTNDATYVIDAAVRAARGRLYSALGEARVAQILAITPVPNPQTPDDYMRSMAITTETKMVRAELLRTMPTMFMDGASKTQIWNDEAAFRENNYKLVAEELRRLEDEIRQALTDLLSGAIGSPLSSDAFGTDNYSTPGSTVFNTEVF